MTAAPLIILSAGGTGGHMFPAQALADALLERGYRMALITDSRGASTLGGLATYPVAAAQMLGRGISGKLWGGLTLARGTVQARTILRKLAPAAVVGFGGYASVPAVAAACSLRIPTLLHEQNAVLGRANRLFAGRVNRIATSFAQVDHRPRTQPSLVIHTGMPVRAAIHGATPYPLETASSPQAPLPILVLGGSQGARVLSDILPEALLALPAALRRRIEISQQARREDVDRVQAAYEGRDFATVTVASFFEDVPHRLARAVLVIGRSGSSTVTECAVVGRPALYIPLPSAADDHQTANARAIEAAGGAWVLPQSAFTVKTASARIAALLSDPARLCTAAAAAKKFALPDAASRLADAVATLVTGETPL